MDAEQAKRELCWLIRDAENRGDDFVVSSLLRLKMFLDNSQGFEVTAAEDATARILRA